MTLRSAQAYEVRYLVFRSTTKKPYEQPEFRDEHTGRYRARDEEILTVME